MIITSRASHLDVARNESVRAIDIASRATGEKLHASNSPPSVRRRSFHFRALMHPSHVPGELQLRRASRGGLPDCDARALPVKGRSGTVRHLGIDLPREREIRHGPINIYFATVRRPAEACVRRCTPPSPRLSERPAMSRKEEEIRKD